MQVTTIIHYFEKLRQNDIVKRFLTVLSLDVLVKASAILLLPIYLRIMTQEEYGTYNYILSIVYSVSAVLNLGLFIPQSKLFHDYDTPAGKGRLLYNLHILLIGGLCLFALPVYFLGLDYKLLPFLFKNAVNYDQYRLWILLFILTNTFAFMLTNYFYTAEKINLTKKYSLFRTLGVNIVSIGILYLYKEDAIKTRLVVSGCTELILLMVFYVYYARQMHFAIDNIIIRKSLKMGIPIMIATIFSIIINFGDKFFLEKYVALKGLSVYYLAFSFASIIALLSASLQNIWLPIFLKEKDLNRNLESTRKIIKKLIAGLIAITILILAGVGACLALNVIPKDYHDIIYILPILLIAQLIVSLAIFYSNYLIYFEKTALILWAGLFISIISISLNMLLIPYWKAYGAACTLLISNGCYLVTYYTALQYYKKKNQGVPEHKNERPATL